MAEDASNDINWYMEIEVVHKDQLGAIRHWDNLRIGIEDNRIWIKDFSLIQINSLEVKSIPYKKIYYSRGNKIYFKDSLLPDKNTPALLWTRLERGLPVKMPSFNHNYFGISEKLFMKLVYSGTETATHVMETPIKNLKDYIETAPAVRLHKLQWTIINSSHVLLFGVPLLPIQGDVFYRRKDFLIPAGYDFDMHSLTDTLNELINPEGNNWILWNKDSGYVPINKNDLTALSLSSFRLTLSKLQLLTP